jgi:hypothetical protein
MRVGNQQFPAWTWLCPLVAAASILSSANAAVQVQGLPQDIVHLQGRSLSDRNGPFLGLGASYFQALRHAKVDRARLHENLALLESNGFNFIRVLSMVSWEGLEIAPVAFTNRSGHAVAAWPDYWQQFGELLNAAAQHRLFLEVTIFADAQRVMPSRAARQAHLDQLLANLAGRERQILFLEVANEAWQNGFPGQEGVAELRDWTQYLANRTRLLVAITSNDDTSDQGINALYRGSAADLATVHFSRDTRTREGSWLPVRDSYRTGLLPSIPPVISNEPIGPGSSVASEEEPIKLVSAAAFAYLAGLPAYVFHSRMGVYGYGRCCPPSGPPLEFGQTPGIDRFQNLRRLLPGDLANWNRNDGLQAVAPFTVFCNGQSNRYWPEVNQPTNGCIQNIGSSKDLDFLCLPIGILEGGLPLQARRALRCEVLDLLTGQEVTRKTLKAGEVLTMPRGPGACLIKGRWAP